MQEQIPICPYCRNRAYFNSKESTSYCRSKLCNGRVIEQGKITYENEVNLHETDDHTKKAGRFGGYESKKDAFKNQLCETLGKKDSRSRRQFYEKFEQGEHLIYKLSGIFRQNEALTNEVISKYRSFIYDFTQEVQNRSFAALAALAYNVVIIDRKHQITNDKILNKITIEKILEYSNLTLQQLEQVSKAVNIKVGQDSHKSDSIENIANTIKYEHKLPFNEFELEAAREIPKRLMNQSIIRGEKPSTIICVVEYMISQLSGNPELNKNQLEIYAQLNEVTKDTAKKLWNTIIESASISHHIPDWHGRKPLSELKHMQ